MIRDNINLVHDYLHRDFANPARKIVGDLSYYGTFFNLIAYIIQIPSIEKYGLLTPQSLLAKQYVVFLFSLIAYLSLYAALFSTTKSKFSGVLVVATLALQPLFFSSAFYNSKEAPFASLFTLSSTTCGYIACELVMLLSTVQTDSNAIKRAYRLSALQGGIIGLCASVRIGGVITLFFFYAVLAVILFLTDKYKAKHLWLNIVKCCSLTLAVAFLTIWVLHPVSYLRPLGWIVETLHYFAHHPLDVMTLTDGEWIRSLATPWYYVPKWIFAQTPIMMQMLTVTGGYIFFRSIRQNNLMTNAIGTAFFLQLIVIPIFAVAAHMNLCGGMGKFLFICPAIAFFSSLSLIRLLNFVPSNHLAQCLMALIVCGTGKLAYEFVQIHPYQGSYFVEPLRVDNMQERWRLGRGTKEALQWLNENTPDDQSTLVFLSGYKEDGVIDDYKKKQLNMLGTNALRTIGQSAAYYIIVNNSEPFTAGPGTHCTTVHSVERKLAPITLKIASIWHCN